MSCITHETPLDDKEAAALQSFRARLTNDGGPAIPQAMADNGGESGVLLRFLRARKYDVDKALAMLAAAIKWRTENGVGRC